MRAKKLLRTAKKFSRSQNAGAETHASATIKYYGNGCTAALAEDSPLFRWLFFSFSFAAPGPKRLLPIRTGGRGRPLRKALSRAGSRFGSSVSTSRIGRSRQSYRRRTTCKPRRRG